MNAPKIKLEKPVWRHALSVAASVTSSVTVVVGVAWFLGEPHHAKYIVAVMDEKGVVRKADVQQIERAVKSIKSDVRDLEEKAGEVQAQGIVNSTKLDAIAHSQDETRRLLNQLLLRQNGDRQR